MTLRSRVQPGICAINRPRLVAQSPDACAVAGAVARASGSDRGASPALCADQSRSRTSMGHGYTRRDSIGQTDVCARVRSHPAFDRSRSVRKLTRCRRWIRGMDHLALWPPALRARPGGVCAIRNAGRHRAGPERSAAVCGRCGRPAARIWPAIAGTIALTLINDCHLRRTISGLTEKGSLTSVSVPGI